MELRARALKISFVDAAGLPFAVLDLPRLDAASGTSLAVTGPSGSGKSTLLYALVGLVDRLEGSVHWDRIELTKLRHSARSAWRRQNVGFVFQDFHLIPELTPIENVLLPARFDRFAARSAQRQRATMLLEQLEVPGSRRSSSQLSRGEQQRVAIARALLFDPPVLIADEPTASLDEKAAGAITSLLAELASRNGKLVLVASHDDRLIGQCSHRLRLERGQSVAA